MLPAAGRAFAGCFQPLPTENLFLAWVVEFQEVRDTTSIPRHGTGARPIGLFFWVGADNSMLFQWNMLECTPSTSFIANSSRNSYNSDTIARAKEESTMSSSNFTPVNPRDVENGKPSGTGKSSGKGEPSGT